MGIENREAALAELILKCEPYAEPSLGTPGAYQVETAKVVGTITFAGYATVIVTASSMSNSPKTLQVPVALNDTDSQVAGKIRAALAADTIINGFFEIKGTGIHVKLKARAMDDNDSTMNLSIANGTCVGLTNALTSVDTTPGALPDLTELEAILDSNLLATTYLASTFYALGKYVYPPLRNGRKYITIVEGTSAATAPETWPERVGGIVVSGTAQFQEDGVEFEIGYDVEQAAYDAWDKKAAKASQFISTPGIDMASIFKRCVDMRDSFNQVLFA